MADLWTFAPRRHRSGALLALAWAAATLGGCEDPARLAAADAGACPQSEAASCAGAADAAGEDGAAVCAPGTLRCAAGCAPCPQAGVATLACSAARCEASSCALGYALRDGDCRAWRFEVLAQGASAPALAIAVDGTIRVIYASPPGLRAWTRRAGVDSAELVASLEAELDAVRLRLDANARPRVAYAHGAGELALAQAPDGEWRSLPFPAPLSAGFAFDLSLRRGLLPILCLATGPDAELNLAQLGDEGWQLQAVGADSASGCALAVARDGTVSLAYDDTQAGDLLLASGPLGGWQVETVASGGDVGRCAAAAQDRAGRLHLSYTGDGNVYHAQRVDGVWQQTLVDTQSGPGGCAASALVVDDSDGVWIAYSDWDFGAYELKLAHRSGQRWTFDRVAGGLQGAPALALDALGRPVLAFVRAGELILASGP